MTQPVYGTEDQGRERNSRRRKWRRPLPKPEFINPYPHMSSIEARVHLWLESLGVPFSWRYFDGVAPNFQELLPDYPPEFTLKEYKVVILILSNYTGALPGVVDKLTTAAALLDFDGWTPIIINEPEVVTGRYKSVVYEKAPALLTPTFQGPPRPNPYGTPNFMAGLRAALSALGLRRRTFFDPDRQEPTRGRSRRRPRPGRRRTRRLDGQ